jgi:hypothetical protein
MPHAEAMRGSYGSAADELTIRFPDMPARDVIVAWIATPDVEYSGLMVSEHTGHVVGVQVDYLADYATQRHPSWQPAIKSRPNPAIAARIVGDVRDLFDRYGTESSEPSQD